MVRILILIVIISASCSSKLTDEQRAQKIIDQTIELSGGELFNSFEVSFHFRDIDYFGMRMEGKYSYERVIGDSIHDVLNNEGFARSIHNQEVQLVDSMSGKYGRSVNSVLYFALLPYGLNDDAVLKEWIGETVLDDYPYDKIKVSFKQEGGGDDFQDEFLYFINKETHHIDFLGYNYETDGGGVRFRKAKNPRIVNGIRFQDYDNFKPEIDKIMPVEQLDSLYKTGTMELLSEIVLENVQVKVNK